MPSMPYNFRYLWAAAEAVEGAPQYVLSNDFSRIKLGSVFWGCGKRAMKRASREFEVAT